MDILVGGRGSAKALDGEWQAAPERGQEELHLTGRVGTRLVGIARGSQGVCDVLWQRPGGEEDA